MIIGAARRIGCSILLLILGAVAWHFRDKWLPQAMELIKDALP